MKKPTKKQNPHVKDARKELSTLRRRRTLGIGTPFGRIEELERFIATNGKSHGMDLERAASRRDALEQVTRNVEVALTKFVQELNTIGDQLTRIPNPFSEI